MTRKEILTTACTFFANLRTLAPLSEGDALNAACQITPFREAILSADDDVEIADCEAELHELKRMVESHMDLFRPHRGAWSKASYNVELIDMSVRGRKKRVADIARWASEMESGYGR